MSKSTIEKLLEEQYGDLHEVIPAMVSENGQAQTAQDLKVTQGWVSRWLAKNRYEKRIVYTLTEAGRKAIEDANHD
jgi:DNA-binding PadR family transcriptional regulator